MSPASSMSSTIVDDEVNSRGRFNVNPIKGWKSWRKPSQAEPPIPLAADEKVSASTTLDPSNATPIDPPPPDGGWTAWSQVLVAHLVVFNSWGYISSFGIFQAYYTTSLKGATPSSISWIGSFEVFLLFFVGTFSGRAMDAGYLRITLAVGQALVLLGVFTTSVATEYWQLFLAQGVCQGLGFGLCFCPVIALVSTYFTKNRAVAMAAQACGGGTGGMVFPAIAQNLLGKIGFGWTVRVMGFVMLFNTAIILALAKPRIKPRKTGGFFELSAFREAPYALFAAGCFLAWLGLYWCYFYVRPFGRDILHVDQYTSFSLLLLFNGIGIPGRLLPAILADRYTGPINIFIPTCIINCILLFCWTRVHSLTGFWVYDCFLGWFAATFQGLFPTSLSSLTTDPSRLGIRIGMTFSIISIACLTGPPIAGALIQSRGGSYLGAQIFGGCLLLTGSCCFIAARTAKHGWVLKKRM